jgi:hypothetical protein
VLPGATGVRSPAGQTERRQSQCAETGAALGSSPRADELLVADIYKAMMRARFREAAVQVTVRGRD